MRHLSCRGTYFGRERLEGAEERAGLSMQFAGWFKPLENYAAAPEGALQLRRCANRLQIMMRAIWNKRRGCHSFFG